MLLNNTTELEQRRNTLINSNVKNPNRNGTTIALSGEDDFTTRMRLLYFYKLSWIMLAGIPLIGMRFF